ncbi:unnamed protein product, partial [Mesorhabditis belari]|uniref:Uncharacterized protein n=1 Tax=Mesorhabditis belari TaxID=2138241 RepID=A0AAF3EDF5_9BILA
MSTVSSSSVSSAVTDNMSKTSITSPQLNKIHSAPDFSNLSNMPEFWRDQSDFESSCFRLVARALTDRIADQLVSRTGTMSAQEKQMKEINAETSHVSVLNNIIRRSEVSTTIGTTAHGTLTAQDLHSRPSRASVMQSLLRRNHTELSLFDNNNKSVKFQEDQAKLEVNEPVKSLKRVLTSPDTFDDFSRLAIIYGGN